MQSSIPSAVRFDPADRPVPAQIAQVTRHLVAFVASPSAMWLGFTLAVLVMALAVCPMVWSKRPSRRKAAADFLEWLLRASRGFLNWLLRAATEVLDRMLRFWGG